MVLCSVAQVRALVSTKSQTDADILNLIVINSKKVASRAGPTASSDASGNDNLNTAGIYSTAAALLRKMRSSGELVARAKSGNSEQQNTIDADIQDYEKEASASITLYRISSGVTIPYGRVGPGTVNNILGE